MVIKGQILHLVLYLLLAAVQVVVVEVPM